MQVATDTSGPIYKRMIRILYNYIIIRNTLNA